VKYTQDPTYHNLKKRIDVAQEKKTGKRDPYYSKEENDQLFIAFLRVINKKGQYVPVPQNPIKGMPYCCKKLNIKDKKKLRAKGINVIDFCKGGETYTDITHRLEERGVITSQYPYKTETRSNRKAWTLTKEYQLLEPKYENPLVSLELKENLQKYIDRQARYFNHNIPTLEEEFFSINNQIQHYDLQEQKILAQIEDLKTILNKCRKSKKKWQKQKSERVKWAKEVVKKYENMDEIEQTRFLTMGAKPEDQHIDKRRIMLNWHLKDSERRKAASKIRVTKKMQKKVQRDIQELDKNFLALHSHQKVKSKKTVKKGNRTRTSGK